MKGFRLLALATCAVSIILSACGSPAAEGAITVKDQWARPSAASAPTATPKAGMTSGMSNTQSTSMDSGMNGPVSAAYMTIQNGGSKADRLIGVVSSVAGAAEVHETYSQDNGMMGMRPVVGGLEIPANGSVMLKPGSYHIMLMNLKQQLTEGQTIKLSLKFASGKQVDIDAPVKSMTMSAP
jgi:copper(I)-binding protein